MILTSSSNSKLTVASLAAVLAIVVTGLAACGSSESNEIDAPREDPSPVQTPTPQVATPEEVAPTPEPTTAPVVTPTEVPEATGLVWTEVDLADALGADEHSTIQLESVGDGRVLALSYSDRGIDSILVTENSTDWTPIQVPAGFLPWSVDITGDRWLIQGWDSTLESPSTQIRFSDDEGANWTEIVVDLASVDGTAWIADAIVAGERIVVVALSDGAPPNADESFEDDSEYQSSVHIFLSDGGPAEPVTEFPGWFSGGHGASDGFHLIASDAGDYYLLYSPKGREWTRTAIDVEVTDSARNKIWTVDDGHTQYRIERFDGVYGSGQVLTLPKGIGWMPDLAVGPAGIAAVGGPIATPSQHDPRRFLIGWSVDGTDWEWQTLQEAFGFPESTEDNNSFTEVQVAVGQDFVLAKVQTFVFPEADIGENANIGVGDRPPLTPYTGPEISASPHRWFIARVD